MIPISKFLFGEVFHLSKRFFSNLPVAYRISWYTICAIWTNLSNNFGRYCYLFLKGEVFVLSKRFFLNFIVFYEIVHSFILWNLTYFRWKLCEICRFKIFYWTRFLFYRNHFCQILSRPCFCCNLASCQISSESVKNFLSYRDHRITESQNHKQNHKQNHRLTRVKQYLSPKQSLGQHNKQQAFYLEPANSTQTVLPF